MRNKQGKAIKTLLLSPYLVVLITMVVSISVFISNNLNINSYHFNKNQSQEISIKNSSEKSIQEFKKNIDLKIYKNSATLKSYHFFSLSFIALIFLLIFKIKTYKDLLNLPAVSNKIFIFIWINIAYIIYAAFFMHLATNGSSLEPIIYIVMNFLMFLAIFSLYFAMPYCIITNFNFLVAYIKTRGVKVALSKALLFYKPLFNWKYSLTTVFFLISTLINLLFLLFSLVEFNEISSIFTVFFLICLYFNISALAMLVNKATAPKESTLNNLVAVICFIAFIIIASCVLFCQYIYV